MKLTVEFLGLSRQMAQVKESPVEVTEHASYRDVVAQLASLFPCLVGTVIVPDVWDLTPSFMLNLEGRHSIRDVDAPARDGQRLLLMFAEAGG
jgi:hypothetical protein